MSASVLENRLRAKPEEFELRCNDSAKSNVWKHFSLVFEKFCVFLRAQPSPKETFPQSDVL